MPLTLHPNTWYRLTNSELGPCYSLTIECLDLDTEPHEPNHPNNNVASLMMAKTCNSKRQYWQIRSHSSDDGTYELLNRYTLTKMRLDLGAFVLIPCMADIHRAENDNQKWKILPWTEAEGDETFKLVNGNGDKGHRCLHAGDIGRRPWLAEGDCPGQHWTFTPIRNIQEERFLVKEDLDMEERTASQGSNVVPGTINPDTNSYTSRVEDFILLFCQ
ncbi:hypothetical protein B7463_g12202, partial [Scytalidium lignicola]